MKRRLHDSLLGRILFLFFLICRLSVLQPWSAAASSSYTCPPEWARQEAIWLGFGTRKEGRRYAPVVRRMVAALADHVHVNLVVEAAEMRLEDYEYFSRLGISSSQYTVFSTDPAFFWLRDSGPLFLRNAQGGIVIAGTLHSGWLPLDSPGTAPILAAHIHFIHAVSSRTGCRVLPADIVLEGGAFEVNGEGVVLLSPVLLDRNPQYSQLELEQKILEVLGQKKAIWMKKGVAEDPYGFAEISGGYWGRGAGGHLDEYVRFAGPDTILLAGIPETEKNTNPVTLITYRRLEENFRILRQATDTHGRRFTIIRTPVPDLVTRRYTVSGRDAASYRQKGISLARGERLILVAATSYLNFIIANQMILLPAYGTTEQLDSVKRKDGKMVEIMQKVFPGYDIVQINPLQLNWHGGGMHCISRPQPVSAADAPRTCRGVGDKPGRVHSIR